MWGSVIVTHLNPDRPSLLHEVLRSVSVLPVEIAKVLRDMNRLKFDKELSFGERRLLDQAKSLLLKELAIAKKKTEAEMAAEIALIFSA